MMRKSSSTIKMIFLYLVKSKHSDHHYEGGGGGGRGGVGGKKNKSILLVPSLYILAQQRGKID